MVVTLSYNPLRYLLTDVRRWLSGAPVEAVEASEVLREQLFGQVTSQYGTLIERICFGYAQSRADLDDLRQDALLNIWMSLAHFKGDSSLKTWIYRVTLNSCVSSLRRNYRRVKIVDLDTLYDAIDTDGEDKAVLSQLHEAIGCLGPVDKAIVMLWLDEIPYQDIANITGVSKANVAVRLHRAKDKLKTIFNK